MPDENCSPMEAPGGGGAPQGGPVIFHDGKSDHPVALLLGENPDGSATIHVTDTKTDTKAALVKVGLGLGTLTTTTSASLQYPVLAMPGKPEPGKPTWRPVPPANPV